MTGKTLTRRAALSVAAMTATVMAAGLALAQDLPDKPVRLVVPFGAGGATDLAARALANVLPEYLGQPVAVVNVPGAGGAVGVTQIMETDADGYTMIMAAIGALALRPALSPDLNYSYDSVSYAARTQINPNVLILPDGAYEDFAAFAETLANADAPMRYGTAGAGQVTHLGPIMLAESLGLAADSIRPVHYDSDNGALLALMQGEVDFVQGNLPSFSSAIEAGQVQALAVTTPERLEALPDVPTYVELDHPDVSIVGWRGVAGPKDLPEDVLTVWQDAVKQATETEEWLEAISSLGDEAGYMPSAAFTEFVANDYDRYRAIAENIGLR
ncbi:MAG: tripartite tricarboxylate transporter substrate binding protein [Marinovum algicola]|jgi:tripartite-type tricarboxylate transporter receptor subunit TctC|uniref:Bug family tripartite tricarboxylate transporter substrate binding protein n=1 Tax=Marinovum algicola TaxID=42444 RepID=UPI0032EE94FB